MMKHKIVIANSNTHDCGKSNSIRLVFEKLSKRYVAHDLLPDPYDPKKDIRAIINIPQPDGHTVQVGIESQGDPHSRQGESLELFQKECEIILVACRTKGETIRNITRLRDEKWQVIWFANSVLWTDDYCNRIDESGTSLTTQDEALKTKLCEDYCNYVVAMIERLVINQGELL